MCKYQRLWSSETILLLVLAIIAGCGADAAVRQRGNPVARESSCATAAECDDNVACTEDACSNGLCSHTRLAGCDDPEEEAGEGQGGDAREPELIEEEEPAPEGLLDAGKVVLTPDEAGVEPVKDGDTTMRVSSTELKITNRNSSTVYYSLRWGSGSWYSYSLSPGYYRTHWCSGCGTTATVQFDWRFSSGYQSASRYVYKGSEYEFRMLSSRNGIDLYRISYQSPTIICTNTCRWAYDGECDDGGSNSDYNVCTYGTDCYDCGTRY